MYSVYDREQEILLRTLGVDMQVNNLTKKWKLSEEEPTTYDSIYREEQQALAKNIDGLQAGITTRAFAKKLENKQTQQRLSVDTSMRSSMSSQASRKSRSSFAAGAAIPNSFFKEDSTQNVQQTAKMEDAKYIENVIREYRKKREQRRGQLAMQSMEEEEAGKEQYENIQKALVRLSRKEHSRDSVADSQTNKVNATDVDRISRRTTRDNIFPQSDRRLSDITSIKSAIDKASTVPELLNPDSLEAKPTKVDVNFSDIEAVSQRLSRTLKSIEHSYDSALKPKHTSISVDVGEPVEMTTSNTYSSPRRRSILKQNNEMIAEKKRVSIIPEHQSFHIISVTSEVTMQESPK